MIENPPVFVFDASAILAYLQGDTGSGQVKQIIADANDNRALLFMAVINVGEVFYTIARKKSAGEADLTIQNLSNLGIEFVDVDWALAQSAASLKVRYAIPYVDSFVAALAKLKGGKVVTSDNDFKRVEREIVIFWIGGMD